MKKVSCQLFRLSVVIFVSLFALSAIAISPQPAMALDVKVSSYPSYSVSDDTSSSSPQPVITFSSPEPKASSTVSDHKPVISYSSPDKSSFSGLKSAPTVRTYSPSGEPEPVTQAQQSVEKVLLAEGSKYATELYIIRSGKPGPVLMIVGGVHGNEPAGYKAADQVKDYSIKAGTLLVLPEANKRAVEIDKRYVSGEGDLNRDFPQGKYESCDNTLSKAIYQAVKDYNVEWLMDMHEGYDYYKNSSTSSVGQSIIYYPSTTSKRMVEAIVNTLNKGISSSYKSFSILRYPAKGSLSRSTAEFLGVHSFIMETCTKEPLSNRIDYHLKAANKVLSELNMK